MGFGGGLTPGGFRGGFADAEAGPGDGFAAAEVLDLDGGADDPDQTHGVGELLAPGDLLRPRRGDAVLAVAAVVGGASDAEGRRRAAEGEE